MTDTVIVMKRPRAALAAWIAAALISSADMHASSGPSGSTPDMSRPRQVATFRVERFEQNPIIYPGMKGLKAERGNENINGPSLIRVPDWVDNPLGKYYLYFAHHNGTHIRLACADSLEGPWTIHEGGVLPIVDAPGQGHIASPDVHVDHDQRRIRMYFHQPAPKGSDLSGQVTWVALSEDGIRFAPRPEVLGLFYFRVFERGGTHYAFAKYHNDGGILYRSQDGLSGFEAGPRILPRVRHTALWHDKKNDVLYVFYSRGLDTPEHLMVSRVENLADTWDRWQFTEPVSILKPEKDWEGANEPQKPSGWGAARGPVHELRDPAVYEEDGKLYLLYSVAGEQGIAIARLHVEWRPTGTDYFPPSESQGGWRKLDRPEDIRSIAGMDPAGLDDLRQWLLQSDKRNFAAVVIRRGWIVLEVERGNSAKTDSRRVASVSKAVCATVLAVAAEQSRLGLTPRPMTFDDPAFDFIPWAQPLSDPRKAKITVRQLLNHTSGICPEATGAPNDGTWQYVLGHTGDPRTAALAFDPGTACGYSTHALHHASLVCETVTGKPYDQFAIDALFKPIGCEHWWFQYFDGGRGIGRHPTHALGMPARDLARIGYCMLHGGRWGPRQVIPSWFVRETAAPTHDVRSPEMRWKLNPQTFSHGWELPALRGEPGRVNHGIPPDARFKPGSGGQLIAFMPSLDLVISRQTGGSGEWAYDEYLRRACAAVETAK